MTEDKLFAERIKNLEDEVRFLKTSHLKTATTISTISKTINVNLALTIDFYDNVYSAQRAIITATTTDGSNMASACYIDGLTPQILAGRFIDVSRIKSQDGAERFGFSVLAGNNQDWQTLSGGGQVNLSYTLRVVGTSDFTISVRYVNIDGGTE